MGPVLYCEKHDLEEDVFLWSHYKKVGWKGALSRERLRVREITGRPLISWASDILKLVGGSLTTAH